MNIIHMLFIINLLLYLSNSFEHFQSYNITLGIPINISNLNTTTLYQFYIEANNKNELRLEIFLNKNDYININELDIENIIVKEAENLETNLEIKNYHFMRASRSYYSKDKIRILFPYYVLDSKTKICLFEFEPKKKLKYFYMKIELGNYFDIPIGVNANFTNILQFYEYNFFVLGIKQFKKINITVIANSTRYKPIDHLYIKEYKKRPENNEDYCYRDWRNYEIKKIDEFSNLYAINLDYEIRINGIIAIVLAFIYDLNFLNIYVEPEGGEILFNNENNYKNLTNLKANTPYYFYTKTTVLQTSLITLFTKYSKNYPFDYVDIYLYKNQYDQEYKINEKYSLTFQNINYNELMITFAYETLSEGINYLYFKFLPKYDLNYLSVKIDNMGGSFYLDDGDIKRLKNIYPGYDYFFKTKISLFQTLNVNIKFNYIENNPIEKIYIFEFYDTFFKRPTDKRIDLPIIPKRNNTALLISFSHLIESSNTNYIQFKFIPKEYLEYLEIQLSIQGTIYDLINDTPNNITNIKVDNPYYFFVSADFYNKLFFQLIYDNKNIKPFKYLIIKEFENRNNLFYLKSINQTLDIKNLDKEFIINISYKPTNPSCKYVAFILETNFNMDYLSAKVNIGGGYYEFNSYINISKIIAGTNYYFPIKISMMQKIKFEIIIDDNIGIDIYPFTFSNIYEKKNIEDKYYNKYYNQTIITKKIMNIDEFIEYFDYYIDNFSTKYILIELIPNINIKNILIKYEITYIDNSLNNGKSKNINDLIRNIPYFFYINATQYQQIIINLNLNNSENIPFEYIEIYEISEKYYFKSFIKNFNKSISFANDTNILSSFFSYMIDSFYTNYIILKIIPNFYIRYLNIKVEVGGGYYVLDKNSDKNIYNLFPKYSYYFFVIASKGEKLSIKFILNSNETEKPFNTLHVYEYSNKNSPNTYLQNTKENFDMEIKDNKLMVIISYKAKNKDTNFLAFEIIPNYKISSINFFVELEPKKDESIRVSLVKILTIILIIIIIFTLIIFVIYLKIKCKKHSSSSIEEIYKDKNNDNTKIKKVELFLLS